MKNSNLLKFALLISLCCTVYGCSKNYTHYYNDEQDKGLAIFSDHGNNVLTCYINDKPWRTVSRESKAFLFLSTRYEVYIDRLQANGPEDTLLIQWRGYYTGDESNEGYLTLHLAVPSNFTYKNLAALRGQRISLGSSNGFFTSAINGLNNEGEKGSGSIYFHTARLDSVASGAYSGSLSGIFEANFNSVKFTRGRFDHFIDAEQVNF